MTLTEFTARLDEFRALWVEELLDKEAIAERMGIPEDVVYLFARQTGLNAERRRAQKRVANLNWRERMRQKRNATGNGAYVPPHGNCRECELLQACRDYRTWLMDAGLPCETLLPDEADALANGGYAKSELPSGAAMEVILHAPT